MFFFTVVTIYSLCVLLRVAGGSSIGVKGYSIDGLSTPAQLLIRGEGGCREFRRIVCEPEGTVSPLLFGINLRNHDYQFAQNSHCPSVTNNTCWNDTSSPLLTYQLIHDHDSVEWSLQLNWKTPPPQGGCSVTQYHVLTQATDNVNSGVSSCHSMIGGSILAGVVNNSTSNGYYRRSFLSSPLDKLLVKVIAYPSFEYPLLTIQMPRKCNQDFLFGCQNCRDGPCTPTTFPPNISTLSFNDSSNSGAMIKVNVSLLSVSNGVSEYFLHIKSSRGKELHRLDKTTRYVILSNFPDDNETFFWLEQFTCGCSNATSTYQMIVYTDNIEIVKVNDSQHHSVQSSSYDVSNDVSSSTTVEPHHSYTTSLYLTVSPSQNTISRSSISRSSISHSSVSHSSISHSFVSGSSISHSYSGTTASHSSIGTTISYSSFQVSLSSFNPSPSRSPSSLANKASLLHLYISLSIVITVSVILVTTVLALVSLVVICKYQRRTKYVTSDSLPPCPPSHNSSISMDYMSPTRTTPLVNVIAIIPHDTQQDDKEAYLAFLDDLSLQGAQLQIYCRSNRTTPADWLQSVFTHASLVLVIINKQFYYEWNGDTVADVPVVFALKQLVHSLTQQSKDLRNFALILPRPSDKEYIPNHFLFHTVQQFDLQDTEGMARYVFKVPEFTVDSSTC